MKRRLSKVTAEKEKGMPRFQKLLIGSIFVLFGLIVFESVILASDSYFIMFIPNYFESMLHFQILFLIYSVFPLRDLFIAILFAYLYYYRGMKDKDKDSSGISISSKSKMLNTNGNQDIKGKEKSHSLLEVHRLKLTEKDSSSKLLEGTSLVPFVSGQIFDPSQKNEDLNQSQWKDDGELSIVGHTSNINFYQSECKNN